MNRHQVLTGACNFGEKCYAVGSVEGIHFTVSRRKSMLSGSWPKMFNILISTKRLGLLTTANRQSRLTLRLDTQLFRLVSVMLQIS